MTKIQHAFLRKRKVKKKIEDTLWALIKLTLDILIFIINDEKTVSKFSIRY